MANEKDTHDKPTSDPRMAPSDSAPKEVRRPVDGTVVDFKKGVQVNPKTGETFDFNGKPIKDERKAEPK